MSFECPLLVLGDPAQLPPIQGGGFFTDGEPDAMLTEVHRQAQDDPIVRMSMDVREGRDARDRPLRRKRGGVARRARSGPGDADRPGAGRPQQHTARLQHADRGRSRTSRIPCRSPATSWCACATTARRACSTAGCGGSSRARRRNPDRHHAAVAGRGFRPQGDQGLGARRLLWRRHRDHPVGTSASPMTSSTTAMCSRCTSRRARNGTTWCCSTRALPSQESRARWLYTGITRAAKRLSVVV